MSISILETRIKELKQELDRLTSQSDGKLTNNNILRISTKLDALIVQYLKELKN